MRNWVEWHDGYERSGSPLASRLVVVKRHLRTALEAVGPSATILSLCSGDGRDVIGVLAGMPAPYGVGLHRVPGSDGRPPRCLPQVLFRFQ